MKTVAVDLPEELAAEVQDMLRKRLEKAQADAMVLQAQIQRLSSGKGSAAEGVPPPMTGSVKTEPPRRKRRNKAEVATMIVAFLRNADDGGASTRAIKDALGTSYSTTFRALQRLAEEKVVTNADSQWKLLRR